MRHFSFRHTVFLNHINGLGTCNMIYGTVYVLCLPKAYKVNIWTLAWFNEQNFSEISPKLYSMGDLSGFVKALCCLLIGPHRTRRSSKTNTRMCTHTHTHTHTQTHTRSHTITTEEAPFFQPKREWWLSLSPQSKMATVPLLSSPIKLPDSFIVLVFDNFLSFVIRSASGSCCMVREGLAEWQELTWKSTAGWNYFLPCLMSLWADCWAVLGHTDTFPSLIVSSHARPMWILMRAWVYHVNYSQHTTNCILQSRRFVAG